MNTCPVISYEHAGVGYAEQVGEWIANPHAYFKSFGPEARTFQKRHPSERLRTMTLVKPPAELAELRPVCLSLDGRDVGVMSWSEVFSVVVARLVPAHPAAFAALQTAGELAWLGAEAESEPVATLLESGRIQPQFGDWAEVVARVQWLFLMCGIRLNEVIVQVDPYTDADWQVRKAELNRKRAEERAFMEGRRAAQKVWAHASTAIEGNTLSRGDTMLVHQCTQTSLVQGNEARDRRM